MMNLDEISLRDDLNFPFEALSNLIIYIYIYIYIDYLLIFNLPTKITTAHYFIT
jgi:hypothetical protein